MEDKTPKFRDAALKHLHETDQIDQLITISSRKSWLILLTLSIIVLSTLIWSIFGTISVHVKGEGILLAQGGGVFSAVGPETATRLIQLNVKPGDDVKKDQVVANLKLPNLEKKIGVASEYLQQLKEKYRTLGKTSEKEIAERSQYLREQNKLLQATIDAEKVHVEKVKKLIIDKEALLLQGVVTRDSVLATQSQFNATEREISNANNQLVQNSISEHQFKTQWKERLNTLELKIDDNERDVAELQAQLKLSGVIQAPVDGTVLDVQASIGDEITAGETVVTIASGGEALAAIIYVPATEGKRIKTKMRALISPTIIKKEEYGSIVGEVKSSSSFPTTAKDMESDLQNEELVKQFMKNGPPITVHVALNHNKNTPSGYDWTSQPGPNVTLSPGTLVTAQVTVQNQSPISLFIPFLKKMVSGEQ